MFAVDKFLCEYMGARAPGVTVACHLRLIRHGLLNRRSTARVRASPVKIENRTGLGFKCVDPVSQK